MDRTQWRSGQRWCVGTAIVEFTKVRVPCNALNVYGKGIQKAMYDARVKAVDPSSPLWAMSGFYASVVRPGVVRAGDPVTLMEERS
jgi:MOSC domain-containing protein YiiM